MDTNKQNHCPTPQIIQPLHFQKKIHHPSHSKKINLNSLKNQHHPPPLKKINLPNLHDIGVFFLSGQSFLSTYVGAMPFFPCGGGGGGDLFFCMGGGIIGLAPHNNFCGSLLSQIFIIFPDRGGLNFFEGTIRSTQKTCPPAHPSTN